MAVHVYRPWPRTTSAARVGDHALELKRILRRIRPDVLHATTVVVRLGGVLSGFRPLVVTVWARMS